METGKQSRANATRLKWMKRILVALVVIAAANVVPFLLHWGLPSPVVIATHLGGDQFSLTNLTDELVSIGALKLEVQRQGQWVTASKLSPPVGLLPHEAIKYSVNVPTVTVPPGPWRLRGETITPVHGLESLRMRVKMYFAYPKNRPRMRVFDPKLGVNIRGPDFFAYPVTNASEHLSTK
jgi:hypothetical protein